MVKRDDTGTNAWRRWAPRLAIWGALAVLCATFALWYLDLLAIHTPDPERWPTRGLDLSHHNGQVDFDVLAAEERPDFVFIKATEGDDFRDVRFEENWRGLERVGVRRGAYHFFTWCTPGVAQAKNFIDVVPLEAGVLPPVADLEFSTRCRAPTPDLKAVHLEIIDFLDALEAHYGQRPILYVTRPFYDQRISGVTAFDGYPLWVRALDGEPALDDGRDWAFWQFSNRGWVPGISGRVDRNVYRGSTSELDGMVRL